MLFFTNSNNIIAKEVPASGKRCIRPACFSVDSPTQAVSYEEVFNPLSSFAQNPEGFWAFLIPKKKDEYGQRTDQEHR